MDDAARGFNRNDPPCLCLDAGDLAVLDNVDAALVGGAGIAPHHRVMTGSPAAALQQPALDWKSRTIEVQIRHEIGGLSAIQQLGINTMKAHRIAAPDKSVALPVGMIKIEHAALTHHRIVVEI